jgi:D-alanyl-D-alanine carboxypeptidase
MAKSARNFLLLFTAAALAFSPPALLGATKKKKPRVAPTATPAVTPAPPPANPQPDANGELQLAAWGAIVIDGLTGKTLYERNADTPQYPASTTKIMTAWSSKRATWTTKSSAHWTTARWARAAWN